MHLTTILHTDPNTLISKCRPSLQMGHHSQASDPCPLHPDMLNSHHFCCQNWTELRTVALAVSYHDFPRHCQRPKQWKQEERVPPQPDSVYALFICIYVATMYQVILREKQLLYLHINSFNSHKSLVREVCLLLLY